MEEGNERGMDSTGRGNLVLSERGREDWFVSKAHGSSLETTPSRQSKSSSNARLSFLGDIAL